MAVADITEYSYITVIAALGRAAGLDQSVGRALHRRKHNGAASGRGRLSNDLNNFFYRFGIADGRAAELEDLHILLYKISFSVW